MWIFIFLISNLVCRWQNTRAWINQACDISSPPKRLPGRLPREMDMFDNKEIFEYLPFHLPIFDRVSLKMQVMQVMTIENPGFPSLIAQLSIPSIRSIEEILQILTWNGKKWKSRKKRKKWGEMSSWYSEQRFRQRAATLCPFVTETAMNISQQK